MKQKDEKNNFKAGIVGYGDLGKQIVRFLVQSGTFEEDDFIFFDDHAYERKDKNSYAFSAYKAADFKLLPLYVGLGYKHLPFRLQIINELIARGQKASGFIHSTSFINETATIGPGAIIYPMCNIDQNVYVETGCILNNSVVVSHDSLIGAGSFLAPGVILSGNVKTGQNCFLGSGTVVSNGVTLGNRVIAAVGSVITRDYGDDVFLAGAPAKPLRRAFKLK